MNLIAKGSSESGVMMSNDRRQCLRIHMTIDIQDCEAGAFFTPRTLPDCCDFNPEHIKADDFLSLREQAKHSWTHGGGHRHADEG